MSCTPSLIYQSGLPTYRGSFSDFVMTTVGGLGVQIL